MLDEYDLSYSWSKKLCSRLRKGDSGERKPSSKPFKLCLESLKLDPEETIMVGDWPERDVVGAKKIGMRTAFARYGDTFGTVTSGADWDLNDISQLVLIINESN